MADENKKKSTDDLVKENVAYALEEYKKQYAKFAEEHEKTIEKMASVICDCVCNGAAARVIATALVDKGYGGNTEEFYNACLNYNTELLGKARQIENLEWRVERLSAELASETEEHRKFVCEVAEKIEAAKKLGGEETTRKIMVELNRTRNIVRENYGISEQAGVDIAINRVDAFYKELTEGKVKL